MRRILILTLLLSLFVAACASGDAGDTTTTAESDGTEATEGSPDTTAPDTTAAAAETTTTAAAASGGGGDDCLVGSWTLDTEAFVANFDEILQETGVTEMEVTAGDGTFTVDMSADGTYVAVRDEWGFNMVTSDGTVVIEINGEESGTWSTDDSTLIINMTDSNLTVDASMEADGQTFSLPDSPIETPPGIASNSEFSCDGDVLTLTNAGVESVLNRN